MGEKINCSLKDILEVLDMNPNQLSEIVDIKRRRTIYDMYHNEVKSIKLENVYSILYALNEQAIRKKIKKRFDTQDLFPYIHKNK